MLCAAHKNHMGHSTHSSIVGLDLASTARDAIHFAVQDWSHHERDRHDNARAGWTENYPLMSPHAAKCADDNPGFEVYDGRSVAIPVCDEADTVEKTSKHKFQVSAEQLRQLRSGYLGNMWDDVREAHGSTVIGIRIASLPKLRKPQAAATEGKAVTRYFLSDINGRSVSKHFESQSAARTAGIAMMNEKPEISDLEVRAVVMRDGEGLALVSISRPKQELNEITLELTVSEPKPGAKQTGWQVFFDYHH